MSLWIGPECDLTTKYILSYVVDDQQLFKLFNLNKKLQELSNDESFWEKRMKLYFPRFCQNEKCMKNICGKWKTTYFLTSNLSLVSRILSELKDENNFTFYPFEFNIDMFLVNDKFSFKKAYSYLEFIIRKIVLCISSEEKFKKRSNEEGFSWKLIEIFCEIFAISENDPNCVIETRTLFHTLILKNKLLIGDSDSRYLRYMYKNKHIFAWLKLPYFKIHENQCTPDIPYFIDAPVNVYISCIQNALIKNIDVYEYYYTKDQDKDEKRLIKNLLLTFYEYLIDHRETKFAIEFLETYWKIGLCQEFNIMVDIILPDLKKGFGKITDWYIKNYIENVSQYFTEYCFNYLYGDYSDVLIIQNYMISRNIKYDEECILKMVKDKSLINFIKIYRFCFSNSLKVSNCTILKILKLQEDSDNFPYYKYQLESMLNKEND